MLTGTQPTLAELIKLRYYAASIHLPHHKRVSSKQQGLATSGFRGRGMDFDEVRVYQEGDEIRHMDWRILARTGVPHTKLYKEERQRPVYLIVDQSASMQFGTQIAFKSVIAKEAATLIAWAAAKQGDKVGAIVFNEYQRLDIAPQTREQGVTSVLKLLTLPLANASAVKREIDPLQLVLSDLRTVVRPGSIIFIFSDFNQFSNQAQQSLTQLAAHNEIVAGFVYDQLEAQLPPPHFYGFTDGQQFFNLNTGHKTTRVTYQQQFNNKTNNLKKQLQQKRITWLEFPTHQEAALILKKGLSGYRAGVKVW